jgi:RecA/RadA recombinase
MINNNIETVSIMDESIVDVSKDISESFKEKTKRGLKTSLKSTSNDFGHVLDKYLGKAYPNSLIDKLKDTSFMDTGLPDLNFLISGRPWSGGIPLNGKITILYGPEGGGKTSIITRLLKIAIEKGIIPVFLDTERALEKRRFEQLGVDWSKIKHLWPTSIEESFDIIEKVSELAIAHNNTEKGILILYDSLAGTLTNDQNERKMDQNEIASEAKVINRDMKKVKRIIERANVGLVLIQQSRINMQTIGHSDKYSLPGGQGLKHNSDILIRISRGKQDVEGQLVKISTPCKNRLFKPRQSIEAYFDYMNGFTMKQSLTNFAKIMTDIGYLKRSGSWCYFEHKPDDKFYSKDLIDRLQNQEELTNLLKDVEKYIDSNFLEINRLIGQEDVEDPENLNYIEISKNNELNLNENEDEE